MNCPNCNEKTFTRYIDIETKEHIHNTVGKCNRESKCCYHYTPKEYFTQNNISFDKKQPYSFPIKKAVQQLKQTSLITNDDFKASLKNYNNNNFVKFLNTLFGTEVAAGLIDKYNIGTSKRWNGANIFWQKDIKGNIRTGKIMLYNPNSGKRTKYIDWVHNVIKQSEFVLEQCLFGEHLLENETMPIAIVESEKTAIISSIYLPQFIWVATGSLQNLTKERCRVLRGRIVALFPDLKGLDKWNIKAKELSYLATFTVSTLLERKATEQEKEEGLDLADYLIKYDYKDFNKTKKLSFEDEFEQWLNTHPVGGLFEYINEDFEKEQFNIIPPEQMEIIKANKILINEKA